MPGDGGGDEASTCRIAAMGEGSRFTSLLPDNSRFVAGPRRAAVTGVGKSSPESLHDRFSGVGDGLPSLEEALSDCVDEIASAWR